MERSHLPVIGVILRANSSIGTGHLMRIRSLLPKLRESAYLRLYVYAFDKALLPMCNDYDEVLEFKTKEDIFSYLTEGDATAAAPSISFERLSGNESAAFMPKVVMIDDYAIDKSLEEKIYDKCKLFVVDDLWDRPHQCHMLLDQTLATHEAEYRAICNPECELLLGSTYSLTLERFYPEFYDTAYKSPCTCGAHHLQLNYRALLGKSKQHAATTAADAAANAASTCSASAAASDIASATTCAAASAAASPAPCACTCADGQAMPLERIFISFGGADPVSACLHLTRTIITGKLYEKYCFTLLAGAANKDYETIVQEVKDGIPEAMKSRFILLHHCSDVADLLFKHDGAIGAYGGMFRERIAAAIPSVGVIIADNQSSANAIVAEHDIGVTLSLDELNDVAAVSNALRVISDRNQDFTKNCLKIYDGYGLRRIIDKVLQLLNS